MLKELKGFEVGAGLAQIAEMDIVAVSLFQLLCVCMCWECVVFCVSSVCSSFSKPKLIKRTKL